MVIAIGGPSCTGKTLLAQRLMEAHGIPYFSIDHLKMGIYRACDPCGYHPEDDDEEIALALWPIVREMVHTVVENGQHLIVEGCYYLPRHAKEWEEPYDSAVLSLFLVFSRRYIERHFHSDILRHRTAIERRGAEERPLQQFIADHDRIRRQCAVNGVPVFEIDEDYCGSMRELYDYVDRYIRSRR